MFADDIMKEYEELTYRKRKKEETTQPDKNKNVDKSGNLNYLINMYVDIFANSCKV